MNNFKAILFFVILICISTSNISLAQSWSWAKAPEFIQDTINHFNVQKLDVAADDSGNSYLLGYYHSTQIIFESDTLHNSYGDANFFIAKYFPDGTLAWAIGPKDSSASIGGSIAIASDGNIYLTGRLFYFGSNNSSSPRQFYPISPDFESNYMGYYTGYYLAKINSHTGNLKWIKEIGKGQFQPEVTINEEGNPLIIAQFSPSYLQIGNQTWTDTSWSPCNQLHDIFIAKYDTSGNMLWVRDCCYQGDGVDLNGFTCDKKDNIYLIGEYRGNDIYFDSTIFVSNSNGQIIHPFMAKYNSDGNILWVKTSTDSGEITLREMVATDSFLYVASFENFGNVSFATHQFSTDSGEYLTSLLKLSLDGDFISLNNLKGGAILEMVDDGDNGIYFMGEWGFVQGTGLVLVDTFKIDSSIILRPQLSYDPGSVSFPMFVGRKKSDETLCCTGVIPVGDLNSINNSLAIGGDKIIIGGDFVSGTYAFGYNEISLDTIGYNWLTPSAYISSYSCLNYNYQSTILSGNQSFIYPNPADENITIVGGGKEIIIYNSIGREVIKSKIFNSKTQIDISDLPSGIYIVKTISANGLNAVTKITVFH